MPVTHKVDPESLTLRSALPPVVRFKRELIIALAGLAVVVLAGVAWFALTPRSFHIVPSSDALSEPASASASETLSALPKSYADVPQLGPPLPGDLGKPILEQEGKLPSTIGATDGDAAAQSARADAEQRIAELKAARQSSLIVQRNGRDQEAAPVVAAIEPPAGEAAALETASADAYSDGNGQRHKTTFLDTSATQDEVDPHRLHGPTSPYMLSAGSVIAASLITGIDSDLPGFVTAQLSENVYDSATGRILLLPQGARLIGKYDSVVAFGQSRALIVWQRIVLPDGSSLRIDNMPATDSAGYAGLSDRVDRHTWTMLKGVVLSTMLGVGSELQFSGDGGLVEAIRQSGQQNVSRAGDQLTSKAVDIQPSIRIRPGAPVRLMVQKDLILAPWRS